MFVKLIILLSSLTIIVNGVNQFHETFQWKTINIVWPSEEIRTRVHERNEFIPVNNAIVGIKIWKNKMYLTIPRYKEGIPVTLAVATSIPNESYSPSLIPYPSWEMQTVGDCKSLQFVQSMEIDPKGRMWIIDSGRTETMTTQPKSRCPPRLVIIDIENNGEILKSHEFSSDVASPEISLLNDIVLDHTDGGYAYITDTNKLNPGIIVYSLRDNKSWKISHDSMRAQSEDIKLRVGNEHLNSPINIDGIALSPVDTSIRLVYYSPFSSLRLYTVPTSVLKNNTKDINDFVRDMGKKKSQADGMIMSSNGILYFGSLIDDAVAVWDSIRTSFSTGQNFISRDHERMQWPGAFSIDENGFLWCVTNGFQNYIKDQVDPNKPNYRVLKMSTGYKNYQYHENGDAPEQPVITAGANNNIAMIMGTFLLFFMTILLK